MMYEGVKELYFIYFIGGLSVLNLREIIVRPVRPFEEPLYREQMQKHHYLGFLPKIGETLWYIASWHDKWVALLSFSTPAWKCAARDRWIGWDLHHQYDRLHLLTNNSRFLILPEYHIPNLASRLLSLCQRRLPADWQENFAHPVVLLETFVDPQRFHGTVYKASNWLYVGDTKGFRRTRQGYSSTAQSPKMVFLKALQVDTQSLLSQSILDVPSLSIIRDVLIRVDPVHLDRALQRWNHAYGKEDQSLAIDGKTMRNAIDEQGYQTHIMSVVGHQSKASYTQKKSVLCP
jgi:Druantia protein DruA